MKHRARKRFGQNFLIDRNIVRKIVNFVPLDGKPVVEIGPGRGALTEQLAMSVEKLIAVEIDRDLVFNLREKLKTQQNIKIISDDILKIDFSQFGKKIHVVGNLPFNITSPILFQLFEQKQWIESVVLMVQKEVAERIVAQVGSADYGIMSVISQFHWEICERFDVPSTVFRPVPKVDAIVFSAKFRDFPHSDGLKTAQFHQFVKAIFAHKRKTIENNLKIFDKKLWELLKDNFDLKKRPQQISIDEIIRMIKII